jgi:hypothetical protein
VNGKFFAGERRYVNPESFEHAVALSATPVFVLLGQRRGRLNVSSCLFTAISGAQSVNAAYLCSGIPARPASSLV